MTHRTRLAILGSTGSIGTATLDVVARHPDRFTVVALAAGRNAERLAEQIAAVRPRYVAVADEPTATALRARVDLQGIELGVGDSAVAALASLADVDTVVAAIVGAAGLRSTIAAAQTGKRIALANKESLVVAGALVTRLVRTHGATLLPVDSEHSAIFQCLAGQRRSDVARIILTASGGPFRDRPIETFSTITVEEALHHPNWSMGAKITIDSATCMNKGLELIEARWLFDIAPEHLDVVIHRESIIHSMVEYVDGSVLAQLAVPDMRGPIAYALGYPERIVSGIPRLDLAHGGQLTFRAPDLQRFPCLALAMAANRAGGNAPAVLNAANEIAVQAFLDHRIPFVAIPHIVEATLAKDTPTTADTLDDLLTIDRAARRQAETAIQELGRVSN